MTAAASARLGRSHAARLGRDRAPRLCLGARLRSRRLRASMRVRGSLWSLAPGVARSGAAARPVIRRCGSEPVARRVGRAGGCAGGRGQRQVLDERLGGQDGADLAALVVGAVAGVEPGGEVAGPVAAELVGRARRPPTSAAGRSPCAGRCSAPVGRQLGRSRRSTQRAGGRRTPWRPHGDGARSSQPRCRSRISSPRASLPVSAQNSMCSADLAQVGQVGRAAAGRPGGARRAPASSRPVRRYGTAARSGSPAAARSR